MGTGIPGDGLTSLSSADNSAEEPHRKKEGCAGKGSLGQYSPVRRRCVRGGIMGACMNPKGSLETGVHAEASWGRSRDALGLTRVGWRIRGVFEITESPLEGKSWNKLGEVRKEEMESRTTTLCGPTSAS